MTQRLNLVTGAMGFSASHLIKLLIDEGQKVVAMDLSGALEDEERRGILETFGFPFEDPNLELIAADLLDRESLEEVFTRPITHVFHIASLYDYSAPLDILRKVNVEGTVNLVEVAMKRKLERFVHWSTCGVFGKPYTTRSGAKVNIPFTEDNPSPRTMPLGTHEPEGSHLVNPYSVSKWEQEQYVWRMHREHGLPLIVVRPAPIYGPGSCYGHGGILLTIASGLLLGVPTDSKNYINASVHVEDVARFAAFAADNEHCLGEDYNVVDTEVLSQYEFTRYMAMLTGRPLLDVPIIPMRAWRLAYLAFVAVWSFLERSFGIPRLRMVEPQSATYMGSSYWISNRKTLAAGFKYRYPDVRVGLADTVDWFRKVGWLYAPTRKERAALLFAPRKSSKKAPKAKELREDSIESASIEDSASL
tara:strand:+ start:586 stop:1839 length:1254 start_codon:yes stop_codon:yes gene_type:complete